MLLTMILLLLRLRLLLRVPPREDARTPKASKGKTRSKEGRP
jgi:hypothetical protein